MAFGQSPWPYRHIPTCPACEQDGWSLRKLQGSVRGESAFFAAMEAMLEERLDWAQIALDNGFSDQSHFIRETRRITGFSPEALRHGFVHEEAFWVYRAWAQLAGFQAAPDVVASSHSGLRP